MHSGAIIIIIFIILYRRNFPSGESFCQFRYLLSLVKISANFLSCVNVYNIVDIATSTTLVKIIIYSIEYFCYTKVAGLDEIFAQKRFHLYSIITGII